MKIGGLQPFTLSDFPAHSAAVVFTQGCNYRCPFCHNGELWPMERSEAELVPESAVRELLQKRAGRLDGVVITGGEPTMQADLVEFVSWARALGYLVKLDTNGSRPEVLEEVIERGLIDYFAMDVKAPAAKYHLLAGVPVSMCHIRRSIALIAASGVEHEFRTTVVPDLLTDDDVAAIREMVPAGATHTLQTFRPELAHDPSLHG